MMGVHTGAALLLCFIVGSNGSFWYKDCLFDNSQNDPRVCGSDGVTYETPCHFNKSSPEGATILYIGPCEQILPLLPPHKRRPPPPTENLEEDDIEYQITQTTQRHSEEDNNQFTTPQQKRTTPRHSEKDKTTPTRRKTGKPNPPKNTKEDNEHKLELIVDKHSINFKIDNYAHNNSTMKLN